MEQIPVNTIYTRVNCKPKLSKPTNKEQETFDNLINFQTKEINLGNNRLIKFNSIELADTNKDGIYSDGEHLKIQTSDGNIIYIHNVKKGEKIATIKNKFSSNFGSEYSFSTNSKKTTCEDFLIFTNRKVKSIKRNEEVNTIKEESQDLKSILKYPKELNNNEHFTNFLNGLQEYKAELQATLGISDSEYKQFSQLSLAIIEAETKNGTDKKSFHSLKDLIGHHPSIGISNIKIKEHEHLYKIFHKFGITTDGSSSNISDDDKLAAAATMIVINSHKNSYKTYCKTAKERNLPLERRLSLNEYIACRWKGHKYLLEKRADGKDKEAKANIDAVLDFRAHPDKKLDSKKACKILQILNNYNNN